jgi:putative membrane protein
MRWVVLALGVILATRLIPGIRCDGGFTLITVVFLLSLFNAVLKPLLMIFTFPFILVTMGLGIIVINALLFLLTARLVSGFHVDGFGSAVGGSIVVSLTNIVVSAFRRRHPPPPPPPASRPGRPDDVIDI